MPVHNGSRWLNDCLTSILSQTGFPGSLEFSVYNDASTVSFKYDASLLSGLYSQNFNIAHPGSLGARL